MIEYKMVDCVHWGKKAEGKCPWEENPKNCNGCQDYVKSSKVKILDSEIMDKIKIQDEELFGSSPFKEKDE